MTTLADIRRQGKPEVNLIEANIGPDKVDSNVNQGFIASDRNSPHMPFRLYGTPVNHPVAAFNGKMIKTSRIISILGENRFETEHTIYKVRDWYIPETFN